MLKESYLNNWRSNTGGQKIHMQMERYATDASTIQIWGVLKLELLLGILQFNAHYLDTSLHSVK